MRKVMILMFLVVFCLVPGCNAARKPAPSPDPKPLVVPETSKVGFSKVDLNKAPDVVKNIAGDLAKRETATWLQVNGTSYILVSTGENEKDRRAEITEVIQKIPAQDFVWLDVRARYVGVKEDEQDGPISAVTLNLNDRTISGVGFEITSTDSPAPEAAPAPKATPAPKAAPTPAASPRRLRHQLHLRPQHRPQLQRQNRSRRPHPHRIIIQSRPRKTRIKTILPQKKITGHEKLVGASANAPTLFPEIVLPCLKRYPLPASLANYMLKY